MSSYQKIIKNKQVLLAKVNRANQQKKVAQLTFNGLFLATCLLATSLALVALFQANDNFIFVECQEQLTIESRQQKDNEDLTDTIKYLEKLDKYFSQIARPRFGRSEYKQQRQQIRPITASAAPSSLMMGSNQLWGSNGVGGDGSANENYNSLIDLVNSKLARKYKDSIEQAY